MILSLIFWNNIKNNNDFVEEKKTFLNMYYLLNYLTFVLQNLLDVINVS